jgi:protein O-GlcNAc transferase
MSPHDLTLEQARRALQHGNVDVALRTCGALLNANPREAAARHLRGLCLASLGSLDEAVQEFGKVLEVQPSHFAALADLGVALAALGRHRQAGERLAAALARDDRPAELHFALGQCRLALGELQAAAESFAAAIARRPGFADAHNNLGVVLDRLGDLDGAISHFDQAGRLHPAMVAAQRNLADVLRRRGRSVEAIEVLERAATLAPHDIDLSCELAEALLDAARTSEALAVARVAISRAPQSARAHAAAGMAILGSDRSSEAVPFLEEAVRLDPGLTYAAVNLGEALLCLERAGSAAKAFQSALDAGELPEARLGLGRALVRLGDVTAAARCLTLAHQARPGDAVIATRAAAELEQLGCLGEAAAVLESAAASAPRDPGIHHLRGAFLHRRGRLADALACYEYALGLDPQHERALLDRGHALESLGRVTEAAASFRAALELRPQSSEALAGLTSCAFRLCDWAALDSHLPALEASADGIDALHPFLLLSLDMSAAEQLRALQRRARPTATAARVPTTPRRSPARLRIAYVSPDFREHPVAHALVAIIEAHDRARVETIGICLAAGDESAVGARLRSAFDVLLDASAMGDHEVLARMRELEVDIAVDLAGHTHGARPALFAARCAPVQVNYLGFSATTGAPWMDYILADDIVIPQCDENAYAERVVRLPHCYLPLDDTRRIAGAPERAAAGLPERGFVFCAFNSSYKISREMFLVWMGLLREVPDSVLWLRSMDSCAVAHLERAAAQLGVDPARLLFAPHVGQMEDYLARLRLADLFLDTLPYNAHTTAADALWAGLPVLTCPGRTFAARVGASLVTTAGLPQLVCSDLEEYRTKALRLAHHPEELHPLRDKLGTLHESGAFDSRRCARDLEALYERMRPSRSPQIDR